MTDIVLITGASAGIGKATAFALAQEGYKVYAVARRLAAMKDLQQAGCITLAMDICKKDDIEKVVQQIEQEAGHIDILINNAGLGINGAIEDVPIAEARRQFEVNVFGLFELTRRVLPGMRQRRRGKIINLSSVAGKTHMPLMGWYHGTKFALEGLSDTLRVEVAPFGIEVVLIEPGMIETEFVDVAVGPLLEHSGEGAYAEAANRMAKTMRQAAKRGMMSKPQVIVDVIMKAIKAKRPKTRYVAGRFAKQIIWMRRLLSDRMYDKAVLRFQTRRRRRN